MIDFVTYKWNQAHYRSVFKSEHVNILRNMIERNYNGEWRLTCITDDAKGIDERIRVIPLWKDYSNIPNPSNEGRGPSCYRRLKMFSRDAGEWLGKRICAIDIDIVIVGDITHIVECDADFKIWGDTNPRTLYNGSLIVFNAGSRPELWEKFDPIESPKRTHKLGIFGSDQAWISCCLGNKEQRFHQQDGVYSFRNHILPGQRNILPDNAKIIVMHGWLDPWSKEVQQFPWIKKHYL